MLLPVVLLVALGTAPPWRFDLGTVVAWAVAILAVVMIWRQIRLGVYVGSPGIKVIRYIRTIVVPWTDVAAVEVLETANPELAIQTRSGEPVRTGIYRGHLSRWGAIVLSPKSFQRMVDALRDAHERHRGVSPTHFGRVAS
jgi:hypothetical protein